MDNEQILRKIEELMALRGLTRYKLSIASDINQSTLTTMFNKRSVISVANLERICSVFGLRLSDFFQMLESEKGSQNLKDFPMLEWEALPQTDKQIMVGIMKLMQQRKKK
ncbi:MAG: helix-turn-helix transcriptional regulator [Eubacteriales bacterium]|nr:helix-turn-helix transcriptional regulator [Eubacteriales bacterium]